MNTRPNGLHPTFSPVTITAPVLGKPRGDDGSIEYTPAATEKQLAQYRLEKELAREAANRKVIVKELP